MWTKRSMKILTRISLDSSQLTVLHRTATTSPTSTSRMMIVHGRAVINGSFLQYHSRPCSLLASNGFVPLAFLSKISALIDSRLRFRRHHDFSGVLKYSLASRNLTMAWRQVQKGRQGDVERGMISIDKGNTERNCSQRSSGAIASC